MGPYSNDPGVGPSQGGQAGNPSSSPRWAGSGTPAWGGQNAGAPAPPMSYGQNAGTSAPSMFYGQDAGPKWPALRLIATVLKVVAWIEGGIGVISALVAGVTLSATVGGAAAV